MNTDHDRSSHRLLVQAEELLRTDPAKVPRPIRARVRWWNLTIFGLCVAGGIALLAPFLWPPLSEGFTGNILAEAWGVVAAATIAWVAFKRFRAERFSREIPLHFHEPFRELRKIALELYPSLGTEPSDAREALTDALRTRLLVASDEVLRRAVIYGRFLELDELVKIDECYAAAKSAAGLDSSLNDIDFMCRLLQDVLSVYVSASLSSRSVLSKEIVKELVRRWETWSARRKAVLA